MRSIACRQCGIHDTCKRDCGQCRHLQAGNRCEAWETLLDEFEKLVEE